MAADCVADGDYLGEYSRFFAEFVARVNPDDQLPVKVSVYDVNESELVGEIISVTLQYLNRIYCPPSLQSYITRLVIQAIKSTCKKQPEICGLRQQEKTYAPLKLMQAVTNEVNEICRRYLDNSRLALLPPPSSTPQVTVGAIRNTRRKMEDRHMILHDLNTMFNIQDDTIVDYYAVFDGHSGQDAAAYCATHLHQYLVESVHYPTDPENALRDAFLTTDAQFIAKSSTQKLNGGTTAVCALLINKKLYIAWVGDSMASLVSHGNVEQLVNPHRPTREDESERIRNMGGVVVHCMGVLRVNGFLSISRAIGDVPYKPYISGEPEIRCVHLDGTEDFLIIACDGLWDYVDQRTAALRVYRQVLQNPYDLKHVHQALLQSAKRAGSLDNITLIVVFLTPPIEIASRPNQFLAHQAPNGLLLNNMDPNNPIPSNHDQYSVNPAYMKQMNDDRPEFDMNLILNSAVCHGLNRNGKHDDEYDYTDIGPETDVDAGEDVHDNNYPLAASSLDPTPESEKSPMDDETHNDNDRNDNNYSNRDNANVYPLDSIVDDGDVDNRVRPSDKDVRDADNEMLRDNGDDDDDNARVETTDKHTVVDDESPPSPRTAKLLQDALIVTDNVADSEDSEDEWDYYRVDPNKQESATITAAEPCKDFEDQVTQENTEEIVANSNLEAESLEAESPEAESPKAESPEAKFPEAESLEAESPEAKFPEAESLEAKFPEAESLEAKFPEAESLEAESPEAKFPEAESLEAESLEAESPDAKSPETKFPEAESLETGSSEAKEDIKCEEVETNTAILPELIDINISERKSSEPEKDQLLLNLQEEDKKQDNMDFQLNPEAAEFVPLSPPLLSNRGFLQDFAISGSPLKHAQAMDDIPMPSESEFDKEVCYRPKEIGEEFSRDEPTDVQNNSSHNMDVSEISSTKAEMGDDESMMHAMSTSQWQTNISSQWNEKIGDDAELDGEDDIIAKNNPMSMSLTPGNLKAAFEKSVDLNAVHMLDDSSDGAEQVNTPSRSPEPNEERPPSSLSEDKNSIDALRASTPQLPDDTLSTLSSEINAETKNSSSTTFEKEIDRDVLSQTNQFSCLTTEMPQSPETDTREYFYSSESQEKDSSTQLDKDIREEKLMEKDEEQKESLLVIEDTTDESFDVKPLAESLQDCSQIVKQENIKSEVPTDLLDSNSDFTNTMHITEQYNLQQPLLEKTCTEITSGELVNENKIITEDLIQSLVIENSQSTNWTDHDKVETLKFEKLIDTQSEFIHESHNENKQIENEKLYSKEEEDDDKDVKPDSTSELNPPDLLNSGFMEDELQQKNQICIEHTPIETTTLVDKPIKQEQTEEKAAELVSINDEEKVILEDIPPKEEKTELEETAKLTSEDVAATESKEVAEISEASVAAVVAATVAATAIAASKTKPTTSAKRPTKATTTKTTATTKTVTKSTPTSPSKMISAGTRTTTISSAAAKKPTTAARPKQLDGTVKATVSSGKTTATKTMTSTKSMTKTSVSPRVTSSTMRPRTSATTITSKVNSGITLEKKSTSSDTKSINKPTTKPASGTLKTTTTSTAKTTLAKTSVSNALPKARPTSATSTKITSTSKQSASSVNGPSRPRTAPSSSAATKPREIAGRTITSTATKSPSIDKQSKETVNKQISRSGASATRISGRTSTPAVASPGVTKTPRTLPGKLAGNASATSPTKKTPTSRTAFKTTPSTVTKRASNDGKILQNGIPKEDAMKATVITAADKGIEDDIPRKDSSPVNTPTDNQLIAD